MVKYKEYYQLMLKDHAAEFESFRKIHDLFASDRLKYQEEFNKVGAPIQDLINTYEKRLCSRMENTKNSSYSANLAEKFRELIRKDFPQIDMIGIKLTFAA